MEVNKKVRLVRDLLDAAREAHRKSTADDGMAAFYRGQETAYHHAMALLLIEIDQETS